MMGGNQNSKKNPTLGLYKCSRLATRSKIKKCARVEGKREGDVEGMEGARPGEILQRKTGAVEYRRLGRGQRDQGGSAGAK